MQKQLTDEKLASEDWKCLFLVTLAILVLCALYILEIKLNASETCTPDFCMDDYCIIKKEK